MNWIILVIHLLIYKNKRLKRNLKDEIIILNEHIKKTIEYTLRNIFHRILLHVKTMSNN